MKKKQNGFTLVELLAVIIILAIIMIIAIPAVIESLNKSRKQTFFEYAQNVRMKAEQQYIQDLDLNKERTDCFVYDIKKDIGLGDTGSFDGWVKVKREKASSGNKTALKKISAADGIQAVKTCTVEESKNCTPNEAYFVPEGSKSLEVSKSIKEGQKVCISHQIANNGSLKTVNDGCVTYSQAHEVMDTYKYAVEVTLTNKQYSVQDVLFSEDMSQEAFYNEIDKFKEAHKGSANALAITAPTCSASSGTEQKGTTTQGTVVGVKTTTTEKGTIQVGTTEPTTKGTIQAGTTEPSTQGTIQAGTTAPTTQGTIAQNTTSLSTRDTIPAGTTTIDVKDESLLLSNLTVSGYDIGFNQLTFNYQLSVPYETANLNITATPKVTDGTVNVQVGGQDNLIVGLNNVYVEVFNNVTGKRSYYRITVRRYASGETPNQGGTTNNVGGTTTRINGLPDPTLEESDASLIQLSVSGYNDLQFDPNVYEYTLVTNGASEIHPFYKTSAKGAIVTVSGNTELKAGSKVLLTVKSPNGFYTKTYTINIEEDIPTSTTTKVIRGIAIGLAVLLIAILIIYSITKNNRKSIRDDDDLTDKVKQASSSVVAPTPMNNNPNGVQNVFQANEQMQGSAVPQTPTNNDNNNGGTSQ